MEEDNIFIREALSKRVQLPSTSARTVSELNADCLAVYNEPRKKTRKSNALKHGEKIRSPEVEILLLAEGFRKYSGELKATVNYLCPGHRPWAQVIICVGFFFFFLYYFSSARKWTNCAIVPMRPMRPSRLNEDLNRRH